MLGQGGEEFDIAQQQLAAAVIALVARLGGVGAAVEFEIQFADPGDRVLDVGFTAREELGRRALGHRGSPSTSAMRLSCSSISGVGPPPPSP